ncbi:hypothetical protein [Pedobacter frigoris]|uniref:hypothetical protein n=1 Tax=Pedobacter frigoris TaxID=2571272 RepID=UPI00292F61CE|nr:hypothetical protein [Pedobacter frigoris]
MLSKISWSDYLGALAVLTGAYYLILGGVFYKDKVKKLAIKKWTGKPLDDPDNDAEEDDAFADYEAAVEELKECILEAAKGISKEELLVQLKERLISHGGLRLAAYQDVLNATLIDMAKDNCGVTFREDELNAAWRTLPR